MQTDKIQDNIEYCFSVYELLLAEITNELNTLHSVSWTSLQYRKLLGNWLIQFIQILFDRWYFPKKQDSYEEKSNFSSLFFCDLAEQSCLWESDETNDLLYHYLQKLKNGDDPYIASSIPVKCETWSNFTFSSGDCPIKITYPYWINLSRADTQTCLEKLKPIAEQLKFKGTKSVVSVNKKWRDSLRPEDTTFEQVIRVLVRRHIPACFLESFQSMKKSADNSGIQILYSANAIHGHIAYKYLSAANNNTALLNHQHGGGYSYDYSNIPEVFERSVSNTFFTWGWTEDKKTVPLPTAPRIFPASHKERKKILLKCVNYPKYVYRIMYQPMGSQNLNLIERTIQFALKVQNLDVEISHYPYDYGWNVRKRFTEAGVKIDEKSMDDGNYQLHVCNYLGTSWLETIAANLPTICFYNPEIYEFRDSAKPYISNLEKVGILHQSPQSAADKVMEVSENPEKWWQLDYVQNSVSNFRQKYARLENDWLSAWQNEFRKSVQYHNS